MKQLTMKCRMCGRFLSIEEAENTTGKIADAFRGMGTCRKCEEEMDCQQLEQEEQR